MTAAAIICLTFAVTTLFAGSVFALVYDAYFRYPALLRERLLEANGNPKCEKTVSLLDFRNLSAAASLGPGCWRTWFRHYVEQAGIRLDETTLLALSLGAGAILASLAFVLTHRWCETVVGVLAGIAAPPIYVCVRRRRRIRRLTLQLPDALDIMCRAVRAGQTVPASFQMLANDFPPPISEEFRRCFEQQNLGISYDAALRDLAKRTGIMELRIFVVALLIQSRSGGGLSELLQSLSTMVRKRLALQQKVRALTGEGRLQASVLIALPFVVFVAMYCLNREYARILLDRPWLLGGCVASQAAGALVIQRLIRIDY
jgi:tight adherence protein B